MKALRQQYESDQPIFVWFDEVRSLFMIQRGGGMPIRLRIPDFNELAQLADTGFFLADKYEWKNLVETIQEDPDIERFYAVWKDDITGWTVIDADSAADKRWKHLIDEVNSQGHTGDILIKWNDDLSRWEPLADLMDHRLEDISVEWILRWRDVLKESYAIVEDADIDHDFVITSNENHYYRIKDYGIKGATHEELAHEYPAWSQVIQYMEVHGEDVTELTIYFDKEDGLWGIRNEITGDIEAPPENKYRMTKNAFFNPNRGNNTLGQPLEFVEHKDIFDTLLFMLMNEPSAQKNREHDHLLRQLLTEEEYQQLTSTYAKRTGTEYTLIGK